jgi:hypothetical protein
MNKHILFVIFTFLYITLHAQSTEKKSIGIASIECSNDDYKKSATQLQDIITHAFSENKNIELLDRSKVLQIQKELNLQKGKEYVNGKTVKQNHAHGAELLILSNLSNISIEKNQFNMVYNKGALSKVIISFSLQAVNVTTGEVINQEALSVENTVQGAGNEKEIIENAISKSNTVLLAKVEDWVNIIFPPSFKITSIDERSKNGEPKIISIVLDKKLNVKPNYIININEVSNINIDGQNKTKIEKIAAITVSEVQGDFLKCIVLDGSDVLEEKMRKKGDHIQLELTDKKISKFKKLGL